MGDSVAVLVSKIGQAAEAMSDSTESGVKSASQRMKKTIEGSRDKVTGDGRLSGAGNAKLGVNYKLDLNGGHSTSLMKATGPWQLIEFDTKSAGIVTGRTGRIKGRGARRRTRERDLNIAFGAVGSLSGVKPLAWAGGAHPFARVKDAPTKGQHPFRKGWELGTPAVVSELKRSNVNAVRGVFGG